MRIKRLLAIGLSVGIIASMLLSASGVLASPIVQVQKPVANLQVSQTANNNYTIQIGTNVVPLGSATTSFTPTMVFPDWQGYAWNAQLGLTMAVAGNALATAGMTSSSTSTSVTASNSYFNITYSGVAVNPPFNQTGGLDMSITELKNIGNTLSFGYNSTNVNAYVQAPLTSIYTVGESLPDGNTVSSVTATTVIDNQGNQVAYRPQYVVGSIALYSSNATGLVSSAQAATGFTTGEIGMLYALEVTDSSAAPQTGWATWSVSASNFLLTLPAFTNPVYPIILSPAGDTFGYTSIGSTGLPMGVDTLTMSGYSYTGEASSGVSITISASNSDATTEDFDIGVYTTANPLAFVTNAHAVIPVANGSSQTTLTSNFAVAPTFTAQTYYLIENNNGSTTGPELYANTAANSDQYYNTTETYGTWPSTLTQPPTGWTVGNNGDYQYSIYVTVTSSGTITTYSPSTNSGSAWTNPANAYAQDSTYATITSGSPSGNNIWGNYGISLTGDTISDVKIGCYAKAAAYSYTPTLRAAGTMATGSTSVACSEPTGTATGDVLVAFISDRHASNVNTTAPTGWLAVGKSYASGDLLQVFMAVVGNNSLTGTSWTWSGLTTHSCGCIVGYYGVGNTGYGVYDTTAGISTRSNASGTTGTASITTSLANEMVIAVYATQAGDYTWTSMTTATLGALTSEENSGLTSYCSIGVGQKLSASAASTGASSATIGTAGANQGIMLALQPLIVYPTISIEATWNAGTNYTTAQTTTLTAANAQYNFDVTGQTTWTPSTLANGTFEIEAYATTVGGAETVYLDYLSVTVNYTAATKSIANSPSSLAFGTVMPGTTYYANGTAYSNPVTSGQCTFTITNSGSSTVNIALSCTNATGGNTWTLVSGSPTGDQFEVIAVYQGQNPSLGLVLTNSNQAFDTIAASGTLKWDFEEITGGTGSGKTGTFDDSITKTETITITGS